MEMLYCRGCGSFFPTSDYRTLQTHLRNTYCMMLEEGCPRCGSNDIVEADDCPKCYGYKSKQDKLCIGCRKALLERVNQFFDRFTAEEEEQFDDWIEGECISNRKRWTP